MEPDKFRVNPELKIKVVVVADDGEILHTEELERDGRGLSIEAAIELAESMVEFVYMSD